MAASGETAFRQVTDFGYSAGVVMSVVALSTGFLYSGVSCDMNLGEWNIVNGVLLATLAFICYFQLRISSKAMQLSYKLLSGDCSVQELLSEGVLPASLSVGRLLVPVLLLIWTIEGLLRARYGTCASTAPLLLGISLTEIVLQLACFISIAFYMAQSHGLTWSKLQDYLSRTTTKMTDGARQLADGVKARASSAAYWSTAKARELGTRVSQGLDKYWRGEEGQRLLR